MRLLAVFLFLIALSSCSYRTEKEGDNVAPVQAKLMGFSQLNASILGPKCAGCHGWANTHAVVTTKLGEIARRINTKDPAEIMPKPPLTLSAEEKAALMVWIQAGGPETVPGDVTQPIQPPPPPPELERGLYFAYVQQKVFGVKCSQCHGWAKTPDGSNYERVIENLTDIESRVRSEFDFDKMPPAKAEKGPLTDEEKDLLLDWIKAGAPKDKVDESDSSANEI